MTQASTHYLPPLYSPFPVLSVLPVLLLDFAHVATHFSGPVLWHKPVQWPNQNRSMRVEPAVGSRGPILQPHCGPVCAGTMLEIALPVPLDFGYLAPCV